MNIQLRDYQRNGANELYTKLKTNDSVLFQLATGGGKTFIFSFFIKYWIGTNDKNVLILVHRDELVNQTISSLAKLGVEAEKINAKNKTPQHNCRIYVAMVQTLSGRLKKDSKYLKNIGLMVVDECHRNDFNKVMNHYEGIKKIGFSATPISSQKSTPLKNMYDDIVCCAGINDLIKEGNLTQNKTYVIKGIEKSKFKKDNKGEYSHSSMMEQFNLPKMIQNTIAAYEKKCNGKKTIIFNVGCEHSIAVCDAFIEKGYNCKYLDGNSKDREEILTWFKENDDAILCNIDILTTGFDEPSVMNVIVNRSTTSLPLWLQMTGRGGRLFPGKGYFNIIDLGGNVQTHGDWSEKRNWNHLFFNPKKKGEGVAPVKECPECGYINHLSAKVCGDDDCEHVFKIVEKVEDTIFELELLDQYKTGINSVDKCKEIVRQGYKPHKAVHEIQKELIKSLKYIRKEKFLANKDKIIDDLKKAFYPKYKELHNYDKETFKLHHKNLNYWYDQINQKLNERFGTNI